MKNKSLFLILLNIILFGAILFVAHKKQKPQEIPQPKSDVDVQIKIETKPFQPAPKNVYLNYSDILKVVRSWGVEEEIYGKSTQNNELVCFKISNNKATRKVLLSAGIHGNEKLAVMTVLGIVSNLIENKHIPSDIELYYIPVISPDSYGSNSRHVDGVDPNRDFSYPGLKDKTSVPPIEALKNLHKKHKFNSMISAHSYGRVFLYPPGDPSLTKSFESTQKSYKLICNEMSKLSGYGSGQIKNNSGLPHHGYEADWFLANSCFSLVVEFGTEFQPNANEINKEVLKTYDAIKYFINLK